MFTMTRAPDATIMLFELDDHSFNEFKKWLSTNVGRLTNIGPYIWGISQRGQLVTVGR